MSQGREPISQLPSPFQKLLVKCQPVKTFLEINRQQPALSCDPEHSGGVHPVPREAEAVQQLFRRYTAGSTTLSQLPGWVNAQGFRTRNKPSETRAWWLPASSSSRCFIFARVEGVMEDDPLYWVGCVEKMKGWFW